MNGILVVTCYKDSSRPLVQLATQLSIMRVALTFTLDPKICHVIDAKTSAWKYKLANHLV